MVRLTWRILPSDEQGEARHIDKILSGCQAASLEKILGKHKVFKHIHRTLVQMDQR